MATTLPAIDTFSSSGNTSVATDGSDSTSGPFSCTWKSPKNPLKKYENELFAPSSRPFMTGYTGHRRGDGPRENYMPTRQIDDATLGYNGWYNGKVVHASIGRTSHAKTQTYRKMNEMKYLCESEIFNSDSVHSNLTGFTSRGGSPNRSTTTPTRSPSKGFLTSTELEEEDGDEFAEQLDEVVESQYSVSSLPPITDSKNHQRHQDQAKLLKETHSTMQRGVLSRSGSRVSSRPGSPSHKSISAEVHFLL